MQLAALLAPTQRDTTQHRVAPTKFRSHVLRTFLRGCDIHIGAVNNGSTLFGHDALITRG